MRSRSDDEITAQQAALNDAKRRLKNIRKITTTNREEKGVDTLFVAIGLATWKSETGTDPNAPVLLIPLEAEATGVADQDFVLKLAGDIQLNPLLTHILSTEFGVETEEVQVDLFDRRLESWDELASLLFQIEATWDKVLGFSVSRRMVVRNFFYHTMPLVEDLQQNIDAYVQNEFVAGVVGDEQARANLKLHIEDPKPGQPDIDAPENEFLVLDADSTQHRAINRVLAGQSLVIQGPPGTGKSQSIANLITVLIANGKRILFVAEKRAAIEAVTKRLDQVGLDGLVMDMHGGIKSRRDFAMSLGEALEKISKTPKENYSDIHRRLASVEMRCWQIKIRYMKFANRGK